MTDLGRRVTDVGRVNLEETSKNLLKKHTAIVHCSNTLTLLQRKISNALLYHAYDSLLKNEEHQIRIGELCKLIGYKGRNYSAIKEAFKGLISTVIEWNLIDEVSNENDWTASAILASVNLKGAMCSYAYSPRMKQLLHMPTMFAKINLFVQSHFRSSYGLALYENCIRYQGLSATRWFEIDLFRKIMGVPPEMYTIFRDFKKRVLDKAVYEVNTFSNIFIEADIQRKGWQVVKIRFLLKDREKRKVLGVKSSENDPAQVLKTRLKEIYQIHPKIVKQILESYSEELISEKMRYIEQSPSFARGNIENLGGLLIDALKSNYQTTRETTVKAQSAVRTFAQQTKDKQVVKQKNQFQKYINQQILHVFQQADEKSKIQHAFLEKITNSLYHGLFIKDGWANPLIQDQLCMFIKEKYPVMLTDLPTWDTFLAKTYEEDLSQ